MNRKLSKVEVIEVEKRIDDYFAQSHLPSENLYVSRFLICTVGEDLHRLVAAEFSKDWFQVGAREIRGKFAGLVDAYKYAMRHALDLCEFRDLSKDEMSLPNTDEENYTTVSKLLTQTAQDYAVATRIFTSYYAGETGLYEDAESGKIKIASNTENTPYNALELLLGDKEERVPPMQMLITLMAGPEVDMPEIDSVGYWSETVHEIVSRVRSKRDRIKYQIIIKHAKELFLACLDDRESYLDNWEFPWSSGDELRRYYAALQVVCIYHVISIHFGAQKFSIEGVGVDQICLTSDERKLIKLIAQIADLKVEVVERVTKNLTLGVGTKTPDPALQPIIPVSDGMRAVPAVLILSGNWPRNILSLHARVDKHGFDKQSSCFEGLMINSLREGLNCSFKYRFNENIPTKQGREEVDFICFDENQKTILIGELRWMIQPGDAREVMNRRKVIKEKISQAKRKLIGIRENIDEVLKHLELSCEGDWRIEAVVIIEGYGGTISSLKDEIPVVPLTVFNEAINNAPSIIHLHALLASLIWLPREGEDYVLAENEQRICGVDFIVPSLSIGKKSYIRESLGRYLEAGYKKSPEELRALAG